MSIVRKLAIAFGFVLLFQSSHAGTALAATVTGHIAVTNTATNADLGYVGNFFQLNGEYGKTNDVSQSLAVSFSNNTSPFSITTVNGPSATYPYFGGVVGFADTGNDLAAGSSNYVYLAGTVADTATGQNSFTATTGLSELSQSALWSLGAGNLLTAQWVNSDSSVITPSIIFYAPDNVFLLVGDVAAFSAQVTGTVTPVSLSLVATPVPAALPLFATGLGVVSVLGWRRKKMAATPTKPSAAA